MSTPNDAMDIDSPTASAHLQVQESIPVVPAQAAAMDVDDDNDNDKYSDIVPTGLSSRAGSVGDSRGSTPLPFNSTQTNHPSRPSTLRTSYNHPPSPSTPNHAQRPPLNPTESDTAAEGLMQRTPSGGKDKGKGKGKAVGTAEDELVGGVGSADVPMAEPDSDPEGESEAEDEDPLPGLTPSSTKRLQERQQKKLERDGMKERERELKGKRVGMEGKKAADSMKRFSYLMGQTELFEHFLTIKKERDPEFRKMIEEQQAKQKKKKGNQSGNNRKRKSEKEEDEELIHADEDEEEEDGVYVYDESPAFVKGGQMRDYQVQGLNWLASLHHNGINGILADEMGLGKTLQTIAFLGHLKMRCKTAGPHLIVVPKSTLNNWEREVAKWVPGFRTVLLQGDKHDRAAVIKRDIISENFDVLITSYEIVILEKSSLQKLAWEYIIIDEAHRIKNVNSLLSQIVRTFQSRGRLLITGTPLQNNLEELWALLNFILPDVFSNVEDFNSWFHARGEDDEAKSQVVQQLHRVLRPFLLRRVKADVEHSLLPKKEINIYVGMTEMQRTWYKNLLTKNIDAVNGANGKKEGKTRLLNIVMQLRKCCNHPYLFDGAEPGPPYTTDEHLVDNSDKMRILDRLLVKMQSKDSRVLIFSQMSRVLDILEDYCQFRGYKYCRIDGGTDHDTRTQMIDEYNKPGSEKFIFLLTTRAGGLGINLVTADIVVLFDSDWNPQADLQAMDRAHRIGQTKQVYVYRFITRNAIEERVLDRATQKLKLDQLVIQQGRAQPATKVGQNKDDLLEMIQHGAQEIITAKESMTVEDDIDKIIRDGEERTAALLKKYEGMGLDALANYQPDLGTRQWEGQDFAGARTNNGIGWIDLGKRQVAPAQYAVDQYFQNALRPNAAPKEEKVKVPRAPKQVDLQPHQFPPPALAELQQREMAAFKKENGLAADRPEVDTEKEGGITEVEAERLFTEEQERIDNAVPLTEEELARKTTLEGEVFSNWNKREYLAFVNHAGKCGRRAYDKISEEMLKEKIVNEDKKPDVVGKWGEVFWARYKELPDWELQLAKIEKAEKAREKVQNDVDVLHNKIASARYPLQKLDISYGQNKGKQYSDEEDRFLLVRLNHHGMLREDCYDLIKMDIGEWPEFRFNWFIKSRTTDELKRRCATLLTCLHKEVNDGLGPKVDGRSAAAKKRKEDALKEGSSRGGTPASAANGKPAKMIKV